MNVLDLLYCYIIVLGELVERATWWVSPGPCTHGYWFMLNMSFIVYPGWAMLSGQIYDYWDVGPGWAMLSGQSYDIIKMWALVEWCSLGRYEIVRFEPWLSDALWARLWLFIGWTLVELALWAPINIGLRDRLWLDPGRACSLGPAVIWI